MNLETLLGLLEAQGWGEFAPWFRLYLIDELDMPPELWWEEREPNPYDHSGRRWYRGKRYAADPNSDLPDAVFDSLPSGKYVDVGGGKAYRKHGDKQEAYRDLVKAYWRVTHP